MHTSANCQTEFSRIRAAHPPPLNTHTYTHTHTQRICQNQLSHPRLSLLKQEWQESQESSINGKIYIQRSLNKDLEYW